MKILLALVLVGSSSCVFALDGKKSAPGSALLQSYFGEDAASSVCAPESPAAAPRADARPMSRPDAGLWLCLGHTTNSSRGPSSPVWGHAQATRESAEADAVQACKLEHPGRFDCRAFDCHIIAP